MKSCGYFCSAIMPAFIEYFFNTIFPIPYFIFFHNLVPLIGCRPVLSFVFVVCFCFLMQRYDNNTKRARYYTYFSR